MVEGYDVGAEVNSSSVVSPIGRLLGCAVKDSNGTSVGVNETRSAALPPVAGANVGAVENLPDVVPPVGPLVGTDVCGIRPGMTFGLGVFPLPTDPVEDGADVGAKENAPPQVAPVGLVVGATVAGIAPGTDVGLEVSLA